MIFLQFAITAAIITVCTMGTLFQYSDKTLVFVYFFLFGLSGIMLLSLISTFSHEQNRLWQLELLLFLEPFSLIIRSMTKLFLFMFYDDNGNLDPRVSEQEIKEEFRIFGVIRKQENNQCQTVTMVRNSSSNTASKPIYNICKSIMFACATCRIQLQMQVCARKVRETATFIAGIPMEHMESRWRFGS
ncbi:hypothetical protein HanXRQr2_Chr17g0814761 [Helianthus annuus]|uniref:Uncharacterized protein n=1 Tax=Helianthus annuus TaxID=4232 RepID=A0A251RRQ7_HELAN|nr:hypothetical protein HanXRQr2_Chr17g0814761 [Helianthus annuus]